MGVSVESKKYLSRIDHLRDTRACVKFLSLEPLLEDLGGDEEKSQRARDRRSSMWARLLSSGK
jgi:protein gp37